MRRMTAVVVSAMIVLLGASAAMAEVPILTVEGGPAMRNGLIVPCNDVVIGVDEQLAFILHRTGTTAAPLTVSYDLSGSAEPGVHYRPLPGSVTFPAGAATVTVDVVPLPSHDGAIVDLTLTVPGDSATIQFVSPPIPEVRECGYSFTRDPWNRTQTVATGQPLHRLTVEELVPPIMRAAAGRFRVVSGSLPPGVLLRQDGSFVGTPLVAGTFVSHIEACRPAPPGTCVSTELTVTSTGPAGGGGSAGGGSLLAVIRALLGGLHLG